MGYDFSIYLIATKLKLITQYHLFFGIAQSSNGLQCCTENKSFIVAGLFRTMRLISFGFIFIVDPQNWRFISFSIKWVIQSWCFTTQTSLTVSFTSKTHTCIRRKVVNKVTEQNTSSEKKVLDE